MRENCKLAVYFLSRDVTGLLLHVEQAAVQKGFIETYHFHEECIVEFYKVIDLKICVYMAADAWSDVKIIAFEETTCNKQTWKKDIQTMTKS